MIVSRRLTVMLCGVLAAVLAAACAAADDRAVMLATTTSVEDSGLLAHLLQTYAAVQPAARVRSLAVGSGEALELGRRGDADLLIVHSPTAEEEFMAGGHGEARTAIMQNDFVIVGPPTDPARVTTKENVVEAFQAIARAGHLFLSRGDRSGTHQRELEIWREAEVPRSATWYKEVGQGMGPLLQMASERRAYALSDRATFFSMESQLDLEVLYEGDARLRNVYSVILVRGARAKPSAQALSSWLASEAGGNAIADYRDSRGRQLFFPVPATDTLAAPELTSDSRSGRRPSATTAPELLNGASEGSSGKGEPGIRRRFLCRSVPPGMSDPTCG